MGIDLVKKVKKGVRFSVQNAVFSGAGLSGHCDVVGIICGNRTDDDVGRSYSNLPRNDRVYDQSEYE